MSFNYRPLWVLLASRNMTKTQMRQEANISMATLAKMGKNENVSMAVLDRLCTHFQVQPNDIIEWKKEDEHAGL